MDTLNQGSIEAVTNWACRTRDGLLAGENVRVLPLFCEFDGMGGTGKSRIIAELGSHHFHTYKLDPLVFGEPIHSVADVSPDKTIDLLKAQYKLACQNLDMAYLPTTARPFVFFDRGVLDFITLFNVALNSKTFPFSEEECRGFIREILVQADGRVDLLFVFTTDPKMAMQGKTVFNSVAFMNSLGLGSGSEADTYARFEFCQKVYRQFFVDSQAVRGAVRHLVHAEVGDPVTDFNKNYAMVITVLDLHLVFKAWESLFVVRFGDELKSPKADTKKRITDFARKLQSPLATLREKVVKAQEIDPSSFVAQTLKAYNKIELCIGRVGDIRVTVKGILESPPKFDVQGLK